MHLLNLCLCFSPLYPTTAAVVVSRGLPVRVSMTTQIALGTNTLVFGLLLLVFNTLRASFTWLVITRLRSPATLPRCGGGVMGGYKRMVGDKKSVWGGGWREGV